MILKLRSEVKEALASKRGKGGDEPNMTGRKYPLSSGSSFENPEEILYPSVYHSGKNLVNLNRTAVERCTGTPSAFLAPAPGIRVILLL